MHSWYTGFVLLVQEAEAGFRFRQLLYCCTAAVAQQVEFCFVDQQHLGRLKKC
jgi:hypothetical protein